MQKILIGALGVLAGSAIAAAVLFLSFRQRPTSQVPQDFDLSKAKPAFAVASFGGTLLGFDEGEWGGSLSFRDAKGIVTEVIPDNVRAIIPRGPDVLVFTGLSHLRENHGAIYLLRPDATRQFTVTQLHALDGAPDAIEADVAAGTVEFNVFSGMDDRRGQWIFLCRRLKRDFQLEALTTCKVRDPA